MNDKDVQVEAVQQQQQRFMTQDEMVQQMNDAAVVQFLAELRGWGIRAAMLKGTMKIGDEARKGILRQFEMLASLFSEE